MSVTVLHCYGDVIDTAENQYGWRYLDQLTMKGCEDEGIIALDALLALFVISISNTDCQYIDTFEKY